MQNQFSIKALLYKGMKYHLKLFAIESLCKTLCWFLQMCYLQTCLLMFALCTDFTTGLSLRTKAQTEVNLSSLQHSKLKLDQLSFFWLASSLSLPPTPPPPQPKSCKPRHVSQSSTLTFYFQSKSCIILMREPECFYPIKMAAKLVFKPAPQAFLLFC